MVYCEQCSRMCGYQVYYDPNQIVSENLSLVNRIEKVVQEVLDELGQWMDRITDVFGRLEGAIVARIEEIIRGHSTPSPQPSCTFPQPPDTPFPGPQPPSMPPIYQPSDAMQNRKRNLLQRMGLDSNYQYQRKSILCSEIQNKSIYPIQTSSPKTTDPQLETYWESWDISNPTDYCSQLENIPVGNGNGKVNVVSIAFGDYTFSKDGDGNITIGYINDQMSVQAIQQGAAKIHQNGGKVKLSLGGATFSMASVIKTQNDAEILAQNIAAVCKQNGLDGVDFDVEDGNTSAALQLYVFRRCRELLGTTALISYTIPAMGELNEPYATVIKNGAQYFSSINVMCYDYYWSGYDPTQDFAHLINMGVPKSKIFWGVMPGHTDDPNEYVNVTQAQNIATYVKVNGLGGIMMWDGNRDTDHRTGYVKQDNIYETGKPDGTYIDAISSILNSQREKIS